MVEQRVRLGELWFLGQLHALQPQTHRQLPQGLSVLSNALLTSSPENLGDMQEEVTRQPTGDSVRVSQESPYKVHKGDQT